MGTVAARTSADKSDAEQFASVYAAHVGRIHALCLRLTGARDHAEELTQEVFVRAFERRHSFREESTFFTWLHRLAVNVVLEDRRKANRRELRVMIAEDLEAHDRDASSRPAHLGLDLEKAIAQLPEGARTVLILHDVEGYQHDEIASLLDIAIGTSKAQLFRARKLLREVLE
jgi:RNA polymerase sigma-70 factor (ECF subfamily)